MKMQPPMATSLAGLRSELALRVLRALSLGALLLLLQACATTAPVSSADPRDPWEPMNRRVMDFNDGVDTVVFKPVALTYAQVVPGVLRTGVRNFFGNLGDVWSLFNNAAQLKPKATTDTALRIGMNTFLGLGGLFDLATGYGIEKHKADFGLTLGWWGVPQGPYVVLPLLGPSTVRDAMALPMDVKGDLSRQAASSKKRDATLALKLTDTREGLLKIVDAVKAASLDPYTFTRDAYLQKRRNDLYDGNPPMERNFEDAEEE